MNKLLLSIVLCILLFTEVKPQAYGHSDSIIGNLSEWLSTPIADKVPLNDLDISDIPLTKEQADIATKLLIEKKQKEISHTYSKQWNNRLLQLDSLKMPFYYHVFGSTPPDGRSLFISLHGGGNAPQSVNDQQYENQKHLYDKVMEKLGGVYLAPRAPTNSWDLWHQPHIDDFLNIIIQMAVTKENVNPNKIYLLGYSAGGDGVYQLAPRMGDRWAAASMMAGHPNETSPIGLKNTPFSIHVGENDNGYDRNIIAKEWRDTLNRLAQKHPGFYTHDVHLPKGLGHWMEHKDTVALRWMKNFKRNPIPKEITWKQDNRHHSSFYWLSIPDENKIVDGGVIMAKYSSELNEIDIVENYCSELQICINDGMLDLDKPVTIKYKRDIIFKGKLNRTIKNLHQTTSSKGDFYLAFPCIVNIKNNERLVELR